MAAVEVIDNILRLHEFRPEWTRFLCACASATPFQTPEWLLTWWPHFGSGKMHVLVFRRAAQTIGILPAFLHEWHGRRQLTLIGTGLSDYLDPLFAPAHSSEILDALAGHLERDVDWEICSWQDLSGDTPLANLGAVGEDTPCCSIPVMNSFEEFLAARPKDLRRNLRHEKRKALAIGSVRFEVETTDNPALLGALISLHGKRWREAGEAGMIDANGAAAFLSDVAAVLARRGMLRFFTLYFNDRIVAVILAFDCNCSIFAYLSGFDPEYQDFSFGRELIAQALAYAHSHRYRRWDFLRGEEPYKLAWGAEVIPKCRVTRQR